LLVAVHEAIRFQRKIGRNNFDRMNYLQKILPLITHLYYQ